MEALQLAQMLADLNDLQAADQGAAKALVSVNKTLDRKDNIQVQALSAKTSSPDGRTVTTPAGRFDKFGRRIFTPPLSRTNSGTPSSIPGTPRNHDVRHPKAEDALALRITSKLTIAAQADGDIDRASTLLSLYEIRAKLKDQDNSSLMKAREKINALAAKQERLSREQATSAHHHGGLKSPGRISYPK
ncbi:hypothetical protein PG999_013488 [Apiospora kogelbergensis]|uniref:Uncharacterized protein n=1 Tax=Apiospora kogelbergensis TaxID=1337665 RepID=A0AAW0Q4I9_9PEZI